MNLSVLEIRKYLVKPNMLEHFIDYFEEHFIFSQQDVNMHVLGQFRVIGEPERFVFVRGFRNMQTRLEALRGLLEGTLWEKYGPFPNELMLEWHHVHLLRPLSDIAALTCGFNAEVIAAELADGTISPHTGVIAVDFYQAVPGKREALIDGFQRQVVPAYENEAIQLRGLFVAEMSENEFPRLPVIQNEDELVVITAHEGEAAYREKRAKVTPYIHEAAGALLSSAPETLLLSPTLRSPIRYLQR